MKKKVLGLCWGVWILLIPSLVFGNNFETKAIESLRKKIEQFKIFFSKMPKALNEQSFSKSPTGSVFIFFRIKMVDIAYDVRKTDSLISPLIGYIYLTYETLDNKECGDVSDPRFKELEKRLGYFGFSTATKAKNSDNEECYRHSGPTEKVRFTFAYQEKRWVFKDVIREDYNEPAIIISTAVGKPVGPAKYCEENQFWEELVK